MISLKDSITSSKLHSFLMLLLCYNSFAINRIPDFETTRIKSTGGAGVASVLMDESTTLNPAPLAFFNVGSFYMQKSGADSTINDDSKSLSESDTISFIASDSQGSLNGSISYIKQKHRFSERQRWAASFSNPVGERSALGVGFRMTTDTLSEDGTSIQEEKYKQTIFGVTHALSESFTMGMVFVDPFRTKPEDTIAVLGFQYVFKSFISLMLDTGADYNNPLSETLLYRAALQAKIFKDFYLRAGTFNDKGKASKGTGAGIGWVQPRLVIDFGIKNTDLLENQRLAQTSETIKETSFSLSYRF
ncbi:hypothetical protein OAT67_03605 [Bacteriovoracaceae bacterium]|nr:hypothetical protein [Bacteriovoracaceae bacterium]